MGPAALCLELAPNCFNLRFLRSTFIFSAGEGPFAESGSESGGMAEAEVKIRRRCVASPVASPDASRVVPPHPIVPTRKASATAAFSEVDVVDDGTSEHEWGCHS